MKILIDLTALSYHVTGIERYALCITEQMLVLDKTNDYILLFRNEIHGSLIPHIDGKRIIAQIIFGKNKLMFFQLVLPSVLYRTKADCYLFFAFTSPLLFRHKGIYNTIHDVGAWDYPIALSLVHKIYFRVCYRVSVKASKGIITVSRFSKERINQVLGFPISKINVIPAAISQTLLNPVTISKEEVLKKYGIPNRYIMSLSTIEPRKNLSLLLEAFAEVEDSVDYDLVLIGRLGWKMEDIISKNKLNPRVHMTGYVEDEEVKIIYKNTICFIFPSIYEGFGMPPLEALALGAPVISSDAASMPEILMDQAVFFKNNNLEELKQKLIELTISVSSMPRGLNEYQKQNYNFIQSAQKVLDLIN